MCTDWEPHQSQTSSSRTMKVGDTTRPACSESMPFSFAVTQIGFTRTCVSVTERNTSVEVCVQVFQENFEFFVLGRFQIDTTASTASGNCRLHLLVTIKALLVLFCFVPFFITVSEDISVPDSFNNYFILEPGSSKHCSVITIIDDTVSEGEETITITVDLDTTGLAINIDPPMTKIVISDPEGTINHLSQLI